MEAGEWILPNGTEIKAGKLTTDKNHHGPSAYSDWEIVSFNSSFDSTPIILQLSTIPNQR